MDLLKFIKKHTIKYKNYIVAYIILYSLSYFFLVATPYFIGNFIDKLIVYQDKYVYYYTKIFFIIMILEVVIFFSKNILLSKIQMSISFDINYYTLEHLKRLPLSYFNDTDAEFLNQKINMDSNILASFIVEDSVDIIVRVIVFICILIYAFKTNYIIGIVFLISIFLYAIIYIIFKNPIYKIGYLFREENNKLISKMYMQLNKIKLIKSNSLYEIFSNLLILAFNKFFKAFIRYTILIFTYNSIDLILKRLFMIFLIIYCGIKISGGYMTIGTFTIINTYICFILEYMSCFLLFGKSYQLALVAYNRLNNICSKEKEHNGIKQINKISTIEMNDISFSHTVDKEVLHNFSYKFYIGKIYCIKGNNGSGKSTLVNLIIGLYQDYLGEIKYNGINIKDLDLYEIRSKLIGISEQEVVLVNDSIIKNLLLGLVNVNMKTVSMYCKYMNIMSFISNSPDGFETIVNEKADNVSGGERQKIAIIRTLLKNANVIIMDEPTSALDRHSIKKFINLLEKEKHNKIIIIITHDNEIIDNSDEVINLDKK